MKYYIAIKRHGMSIAIAIAIITYHGWAENILLNKIRGILEHLSIIDNHNKQI